MFDIQNKDCSYATYKKHGYIYFLKNVSTDYSRMNHYPASFNGFKGWVCYKIEKEN